MSVVVVAVIRPRAGLTQRVIDAFEEVSPLVHEEPGCELYAAHVNDEVVVMVEQWSSKADLDAHATGSPLKRLHHLFDGILDGPVDVYAVAGVPLGKPSKGQLQIA
ncbi:antibiotic biosynthesis monooxygenase [Nocardioides immobilis]|uniref:Antibiotic biosynthesis monooxygenase n=1 Tax=Nocardioides immobilis TaxID=2049295 RepID=A0A417XU97_9ACTN|nr:antibiotic biosynthesis monooxygenase family protein [Nocardioides immobilis]RHW23787.1 antibiotic biosynthesis monooxygenase [Nocardioides immobilis]